MLNATDTDTAPWHIVQADDKKRARLNCIAHLLDQIPYKDLTEKQVKLGERKTEKNTTTRPRWPAVASCRVATEQRTP
jgi:hypothetical protein